MTPIKREVCTTCAGTGIWNPLSAKVANMDNEPEIVAEPVAESTPAEVASAEVGAAVETSPAEEVKAEDAGVQAPAPEVAKEEAVG